jgi:hypothetical protein
VDPEEALLIALTAKSFHVHIFNGDDKLHTQLDWFPVATNCGIQPSKGLQSRCSYGLCGQLTPAVVKQIFCSFNFKKKKLHTSKGFFWLNYFLDSLASFSPRENFLIVCWCCFEGCMP